MSVSDKTFAKLAKSAALLAFASEPAWDNEFDESCMKMSRLLVKQGYYSEALDCAEAPAAHSNDKRSAFKNFAKVCREIFKRTGFKDAPTTEKALKLFVSLLDRRDEDLRDVQIVKLGKDAEKYGDALIALGQKEQAQVFATGLVVGRDDGSALFRAGDKILHKLKSHQLVPVG